MLFSTPGCLLDVILCSLLGALLTDVACYCERAGLLFNSLFLLRSQKLSVCSVTRSAYVRVCSSSQQMGRTPS